MNMSLSVLFFEEYFVCTILPNESAWETLNIDGTPRVPLFFYVSGGDVRNDAFAKERFEAGDQAAFGNFYATILDTTRTFRRFDLELDPIQLLNDVTHKIKSAYFDRMKAFDDNVDTASQISLNLCFVPGVPTEAKEKIRAFLAAEGFLVENDADYLAAFLRSLQRKAVISSKVNVAIVEPSFGDLWFHYVECNDGIVRRDSERISGRGVDHRVGNLARMFVEKAARQSASRILNEPMLLEKEIKQFHRRAAIEINRFEYNELDLTIDLSDYSSARVIIDQRELERMSSESFKFIKFRFEQFISKHSNLTRTEKILLNGDLLASGELVQFFERSFGASKVIRPFDNFIELLSRGVFTLMPERAGGEKQVEIKIIVTTKAVAPGVPVSRPEQVAPPRLPPLPRRKSELSERGAAMKENDRSILPPPLPPMPRSKGVDESGKQGAAESSPPKAAPPPLPPSRVPTRDSKKTTDEDPRKTKAPPAPPVRAIHTSVPSVPPLPPLPPVKKKTGDK